jgi:hypothetical protein
MVHKNRSVKMVYKDRLQSYYLHIVLKWWPTMSIPCLSLQCYSTMKIHWLEFPWLWSCYLANVKLLTMTDCEGQSIVEASGLQFSVLQVNKIGGCMLQSWVHCGRLSWTVLVTKLWSAVLECRIARELVSCHRRTVHLRYCVSVLWVLLIEVSCSCWNTCE